MLIDTFFPKAVINTWHCRGSICSYLFCMSCQHSGMSGVWTTYMNNNIHVISYLIHYSFSYQHTLFCIQKKSFASAAAYIHLLHAFVTEVAGYGFYCVHINGTVFFKRGIKGNSNVAEFIRLVF